MRTGRFGHHEKKFVCWTALLALLPLLSRSEYVQHLCVTALIYILTAQGLNIVLGYCGTMTLGQAGFYAIGGYVFAIAMTKAGLGWWTALLAAVAVTTVVGFLLGAISLRVRGSSFIIITILFSRIVHMVLLNWIEMTNGQAGITGVPAPVLFGRALTGKVSLYYFVLIFVALTQFLIGRLVDSKIGRAFIAVKQDESLATSLGISPYHFSLAAFSISVAVTALAGVLHASYAQMVSPEMAGFNNVMLYIIMMTVVGGRGTLWGPVLGAFIFTFLPEYLRVADTLRMPIFGVLLIVLVLFIPDGLIPTFYKALRRWQARQRTGKEAA